MAVQDPTYTRREEELALIEPGPAVSWGAVVAGAIAAAAISIVLLAIGTAFGLSMLSPSDMTESAEDSAAAVGIGAAVFLIVVHAVSSGFGGYLAGRLREKLTNLRHDETYFRDTAHGMLVWALSAVAGAILVACFSAQVISGGLTLGAAGVSAAGQAAGGAVAGVESGMGGLTGSGQRARTMAGYFVDSLFRPASGASTQLNGSTSTAPATGATTTPPADMAGAATSPGSPEREREGSRGEAGRILRISIANGQIAPEDKTHVAQLIAQETGMPQVEAERRVDEVIGKVKAAQEQLEAKARDAAEKAREAAKFGAIWSAIAMLAGAFAASFAATLGGKARDL